MKKRSILSIVLVLAMLFSLAIVGSVQAFAADANVKTKDQIKLIADKFSTLKQAESKDVTWYYAVADLDHNGLLEFIAATQAQDLSTSAKIWTVSKDAKSLTECKIDQSGGASFPDILTDMLDTYHVTDTDTWYYMVTDAVMVSATNINTAETALKLKDGVVSYETYAIENTIIQNGYRAVTHLDKSGMPISAEQYNAAGANAFAGAERSSTALEWLTADKAKNADSLTESYDVFMGTREPTEVFPVPKTDGKDAPVPVPVPVPVQPDQPWLYILKNPTNENRVTGESAIFIAGANAFDSLTWTFVSPDGGEYTPANFVAGSGTYVNGEHSTTLTVSNLESWENGWGVYCTFYYRGQTARTTVAYMYITNRPTPTPQPQPSYGSMSGTAYKNGGWYSIRLQNGTNVSVSSGICKVEGQFYDGCSAIVYYTNSPTATNIYQVNIYGNQGLIVPDQPTHATGLIIPDGALGGYAGSQYYNNEPTEADQGGWAGMHYYDNEPDEEDQGGWAGAHYYDNEPDEDDRGGWAGMHYYDNMP